MRKNLLYVGTLLYAGCFIASCSNEDEAFANVPVENNSVTIRAGITEDSATRIALGESSNGKTKVLWSAGDAFSLINCEKDYTFSRAANDTEEVASADFSYTGTETLPDLSNTGLFFSYPATGIPTNYAYQTGTKEGLSDYMVMTATVPEGASWENLHLSFKHNTAVVKITLTNEVFKDKDVTVSLNATGLLEYSTFITSDALAADGNGTVTAYFAVPATEKLSDCKVQAICDNVCYSSTLGAKSITAGKLYKVNKNDMEEFANIVTLTEAGTLSTLISEDEKYTITSLIVCGDLNGTDIKLLREMAGSDSQSNATEGKLQYLDMSNATIVTGGDYYYSTSTNTTNDAISNYSFYKCTALEEVILPRSITAIGISAFKGCSNLKSINIHKNITTIGGWAFSECTSLESISIPNSVTNSMSNTFYGCTSLKHLIIEDGSSDLSITATSSFSNCPLETVYIGRNKAYPAKGMTTLKAATIGTNVTSIGGFNGCSNLTTVNILASNATIIENEAFLNCKKMECVNIPNTITKIGDYAFCNCLVLTDLDIPENINQIGQNAFNSCFKAFSDLILPEGLTEIADYAFGYCNSIKSLTIPTSVKNIGYEAFYSCEKITALTIPEGVETIESYAFCENENLTTLTLSSSVTSIGTSAFGWCSNLVTVYSHIFTPPTITAFSSTVSNCTLYVPTGCMDTYKTTSGWESFGGYIEM